jgi:hypothetical protein
MATHPGLGETVVNSDQPFDRGAAVHASTVIRFQE